MEPEETNEEMEVEEVTAEEQVMDFASSVADKAKMVEAGDMTVADFVSECMDTLGSIEVAGEGTDVSPMGGLGGSQSFPLPDAE